MLKKKHVYKKIAQNKKICFTIINTQSTKWFVDNIKVIDKSFGKIH